MPIQKNCEICSKVFFIKPNQDGKLFCCSRVCSAERRRYAHLGENNCNYRNLGYSECLLCGGKYRSYNKNRKYCSTLCANTANRIDPDETQAEKKLKIPKPTKKEPRKCKGCGIAKPKDGRRYCVSCKKIARIDTSCKVCGTIFKTYASKIKKTCSKECTNISRVGAGNPNYIDGRTPENKRIRNSEEYKNWRLSVFRRDKFTCVWCGQLGGTLHADHIKPFSRYPDLRLDLNNGRTLCKPCHQKTDTYLKGNKTK